MQADKLEKWAEYLLKIGEDKITKKHGYVELPKEILSKADTLHSFVEEFFPDLENGLRDHSSIVLTPLNKHMDKINQLCFKRFPGHFAQSLKSVDTVVKCKNPEDFSIEDLNAKNTKPNEIVEKSYEQGTVSDISPYY